MLVFIIPVKSKQVSKNWKQVSQLFENCVRSCCGQTSNDFRVIVVCHEKPDIDFHHPLITYVQVDFPRPSESPLTGDIIADKSSKELDKLLKLQAGLEKAKTFASNSTHAMFLDADDLVSNQLAGFVEQHPDSNGWFFVDGYEYFYGSKRIFKRRDFHNRCGSSFILKFDLLCDLFIGKILSDFSLAELEAFAHIEFENLFIKRGTPLEPLPFEGAIYVIDNGENIYNNSGLYLKQLLISRNFWLIFKRIVAFSHKFLVSKAITKEMQKEFSLPDIP
jgi:hypothetical protein